jgi:hypothetical protein
VRAGRGVGEQHGDVAGAHGLAVDGEGRADVAGDAAADLERVVIVEGGGREAVARYQAGDASVGEAARLADVTVSEWIEIADERNLTLQVSADDLADDARTAQEL